MTVAPSTQNVCFAMRSRITLAKGKNVTMKLKALLLGIGLVSCALTDSASADVILGNQTWFTSGAALLALTPVVPGGNQPLNSPCIICGANQPQQNNFGYNDFGNQGGVNEYAMFSTAVTGALANDQLGVGYDVSFLRAFLIAQNAGLLSWTIGVDVNDTNSPQILESFYFLNLSTHTVLSAFSPEPGGTPVPSQNNGTGFPDYTLSGFSLNRGDIGPNDQLIFFARWSNANDGPDSFFLVPNVQTDVPEPSTWAMMFLGFAGIGLYGMRKRRSTLRLA